MSIKAVPDNAAWRASDFSGPDDYSLVLDRCDLGELDTAIEALDTRRIPVTQSLKSDYPFPNLGPKLVSVYEELRSGRGFILIRGLLANDRSADWMRAAVWGIGTWLGRAVNQLIEGSLLTDVTHTSKDNTDARYYNSADELDLHVDPTCDIVGLACYRQATSGGATYLSSAITAHNDFVAERPDLLPILYRGFHLHRFGEHWPEDGDLTSYRVPFFANIDGKLSWRGFHPSMFAAARERGKPLTETEIQAIETFNEISKRPQNRIEFTLEPGDIWITNNLVVQHGRSQFVDEKGATQPRLMFRLWLEATDFRPIPRK